MLAVVDGVQRPAALRGGPAGPRPDPALAELIEEDE